MYFIINCIVESCQFWVYVEVPSYELYSFYWFFSEICRLDLLSSLSVIQYLFVFSQFDNSSTAPSLITLQFYTQDITCWRDMILVGFHYLSVNCVQFDHDTEWIHIHIVKNIPTHRRKKNCSIGGPRPGDVGFYFSLTEANFIFTLQ